MDAAPQKRQGKFAFLPAFLKLARAIQAAHPVAFWVTLAISLIAGVLEAVGILLLVPFLSAQSGETSEGLWSWITRQPAGTEGDYFSAQLILILIILLALAALRAGVLWLRDMKSTALANDFVNAHRHRLVDAIADAEWRDVVKASKSGLSHLIVEDSFRLEIAVASVLGICIATVFAGVQVAIAFVLSPVLTLLVLAALFVTALYFRHFLSAAYDLGWQALATNQGVFAASGAFVTGLKQARVSGQQSQYLDNLKSGFAAQKDLALQTTHMHTISTLGFGFVLVFITCILVGVGVLALGIAVPLMVALIVLFARIGGTAQSMLAQLRGLAEVVPAYENLMEQVAFFEARKAPAVEPKTSKSKGSFISANGLSFAHDSADGAAIRDVSFDIKKGQIALLSGPSGVGKTTLLDLAAGLFLPDAGHIQINGRPPRAAFWSGDPSLLYLVQSPYVPAGTIREILGDGTDAYLENALKSVELWDRIQSLPGGLDGALTEDAETLSGGEVQRLMFARVFLSPPDVLFLDEATNALDASLEARILDRLKALKPRPTILCISHHGVSKDWADQVIALDGPAR